MSRLRLTANSPRPLGGATLPARAVRCAVAIQEALEAWQRQPENAGVPALRTRMGIHTGQATVGEVGSGARVEFTVIGDVVNTTARLQAAAPVNGVLVGETTYRATRDVVEYAEHEPVVAKGKSEPIPVWEAVQVRSRLGMDVEAVHEEVKREIEAGVQEALQMPMPDPATANEGLFADEANELQDGHAPYSGWRKRS